jgi:hypothetical protein
MSDLGSPFPKTALKQNVIDISCDELQTTNEFRGSEKQRSTIYQE